MRFRQSIGIFAILLSAALPLAGCDLFLGDTKTSKGVLYQSGDQRYDPYFDQVHREQLAAASWADDAKQSRKQIVTALNLKPDAPNGTILSATHDTKSGAAALGAPVEQTTTSETERAKHMNAEAKRLEDLRDHGKDLRTQAGSDRENMGAQKADDKAVAKKDEVRRELGAAVDAVDKMVRDARKASREAEELAEKLTAAWTGHPEDEKHLNLDGASPAPAATPAPTAKKPDAPKKPKPAAAPATAPASKPAPAPTSAPKPPDEVFNP